ncbi:hypothetical protein [Halopiger xanaduensis]|uniref:DUF2065 domain-containing protein n=1 Tax=Halopiger xanaduensis (strain DSM 18323 / JCM 14033 / SH-6) TaxID=797210 RepID=F8DBB5_HALXS|nr:hypothetical protein [Halopiger xanaduensis]AEH35891.1 hypothetical protein Halxa_1258 [Halopiger xanaduensis SH-6]
MEVIAGVLLFLVGTAGFLWPERALRFWFLGLLSEDALSDAGKLFFRGLGGVCTLIGTGLVLSGG